MCELSYSFYSPSLSPCVPWFDLSRLSSDGTRGEGEGEGEEGIDVGGKSGSHAQRETE